jgi:hypothetical protein
MSLARWSMASMTMRSSMSAAIPRVGAAMGASAVCGTIHATREVASSVLDCR